MSAPIDTGLPEVCFVALEARKPGERIGLIKRGKNGYYSTDLDEDETTFAEVQLKVAGLNAGLGVSLAQSKAMQFGSMFGWHVPGANPATHGAA